MELRQFEHFFALAQETHFTRAAKRVNIVQSALSSSIAALEVELGVRLFHRTTRKVRLTAAGEVFYEHAAATLESIREARRAIAAMRNLEAGRLLIGTVQALPAYLDLAAILAAFHHLHPAIEVRLRQSSRVDLPGMVLSGQIDLAFAPLIDLPAGLLSRVIVDEPLVLACSAGHRLAQRTQVAIDDLAAENFIDFQPGWGTRSLVDRLWKDRRARHIVFEVSDLDTLLSLAARGLGVALVPERNVRDFDRPLRAVPLASDDARWQMIVIHRGETEPAVDAFLALPALVG